MYWKSFLFEKEIQCQTLRNVTQRYFFVRFLLWSCFGKTSSAMCVEQLAQAFSRKFYQIFFFYKTPPNDCFCISHAFQKHRYNKICPPRQQKFTKKDSKRYLMFGPNNILLTLRWNDGCFPGHENVCRLFLNRCKWLLGPSKLRNRVFVGKCWIWILIFFFFQNHCV